MIQLKKHKFFYLLKNKITWTNYLKSGKGLKPITDKILDPC